MEKAAAAQHEDDAQRAPVARPPGGANVARAPGPASLGIAARTARTAMRSAATTGARGGGASKAETVRNVQATRGNAQAQALVASFRARAEAPRTSASPTAPRKEATKATGTKSPAATPPTTGSKGAAKSGASGAAQAAAAASASAKRSTARGGGAKGKKPTLRQDAGGGPIAGAGGGGGGGGGDGGRGAKSPASPDEDPAFQEVKKKTKRVAAKEASHPSATSRADAAQGAAVGPTNEVASKAQANQASAMNEQKPKAFDRAAFKKALLAKIEQLSPKNLEEADDFKDSGKAGQVKSAVTSEVTAGKEGSASDIKGKTNEAPSTAGIDPKPVTPLTPNAPGSKPASVGATAAAPKPKADAEISLQEGSKQLDSDWKETKLDEKSVAESNEPSFKKTFADKQGAQKDALERPQAYRKAETGELGQAQQQAGVSADAKLAAVHAGKVGAFDKVGKGQSATKTKDEQERARIASEMQAIFDRTKTAVQNRLTALDQEVNQTFDQGAEAARTSFESYVDGRMRAYKRERYGGWFGGARWAKDKLFGMPDEVNTFYSEGRELYLKAMDAVIDRVATVVETGLNAAKALIAKGKEEIDGYVASLDPQLRHLGKEAAQGFQSQFEELEQSVNEKSEALVDSLAQKYVENLKKLDERIEEMKAANRGLVDKVVGAIKELIKTLRELANMLLNTLARAAAAISKILKAPIRFLGNMVAAVKQGIMGFKAKIGEYLQEGLLAWLFGALGDAGITMPKSLDFKGILSLALQVLGLTYANIRARAVKIVGEPVVKALEKGAEIFKILLTEGPAGLWSYIKEQLGNLQEMVIEGIKGFIIEKIIVAGITWLIGLLNPASAFIKACKAIYDIVMFFVTRASQIMAFVNAVIDSMVAIADGNIGAAAAAVEASLAKAIPVVIGFLASLLGLGGISEKIRSVIEKIRAPVNKAIDWVINKAVAIVKKVGKFLGIGKKDEPAKPLDPEHDAKVEAGLHALDVEEAALKQPDGTLEQEEVEKIAVKVRRAHPIFKSIQVVASGDHWTYDYRASKGTHGGAKTAAHPSEGKKGLYPQADQKAAAAKVPPKRAWESHHIPQKVLGKYFAEVYEEAAKTASPADKKRYKDKRTEALSIGEVGNDISAVLLSSKVHDGAHGSLDKSESDKLKATLKAEGATTAQRTSTDDITAAGRVSSFRHARELEKTLFKQRSQEIGAVFKRMHTGATIAGMAAANRVLPAKKKIKDINVSPRWKAVMNPDK